MYHGENSLSCENVDFPIETCLCIRNGITTDVLDEIGI